MGPTVTAATVPSWPTWAGSPGGWCGRWSTVAWAEEASIQRLLADHLGGQSGALPVASGSWHATTT